MQHRAQSLKIVKHRGIQYSSVQVPFIQWRPCIVWMSFMMRNAHIKLLLFFSAVNFDIKFVTQYEHGTLKHWIKFILKSGAIGFIVWWFAFYQLSVSLWMCAFDTNILHMWPQIDSHIFTHFDSNGIIGPCAVFKSFTFTSLHMGEKQANINQSPSYYVNIFRAISIYLFFCVLFLSFYFRFSWGEIGMSFQLNLDFFRFQIKNNNIICDMWNWNVQWKLLDTQLENKFQIWLEICRLDCSFKKLLPTFQCSHFVIKIAFINPQWKFNKIDQKKRKKMKWWKKNMRN